MNSLLYVAYCIATISHDDSILFDYLLPILAVASIIATIVCIKSERREIQFLGVIITFLTMVTFTGSILYTFLLLGQ